MVLFYFSGMTLPITMECLEENAHVDKRITSLVCPLGASMNMDGTALYFVMMVIYLLRMRDRIVGFAQVITTA